MAVTSAAVPGVASPTVPGAFRRGFWTITFDNSYPTGGYAVTPALFGLGSVVLLDPNPSSAAHPVIWNTATNRLQVFTAQGAEVANATNLSAFSCLAEVIGY